MHPEYIAQEKYEENLKKFFQKALFEYELYKKVKREIDRYLSTDFNFIDIISPDENKISILLKILLEPNGTHGQGNLFLELFLKQLKDLSKRDLFYSTKSVVIATEKPTDENRRIDIVIEFDDFIVAIENKPWAGEQDEQLEAYYNYLIKSKKDFILIFLAGTKRDPISISKEHKNSDKFLNTTYKALLVPWLKECYKNCESQKVKFFVKDFQEWIERNFKEMEEF
ncbi:PD-(D/E)XK nuclease family protein [Nitratiruptor tergarcus]|uniref:PD-(D/E)XK nuclease superfamily protein n=1 Tax=Nitratiruptor tergarcus DSM 16512 TaxID=1069081 RepID=A0A1W1WVK0_9BACT|nr:PD-(D/E)XK nuclease family protein [Nitratiruptor tergarcus]SMC10060.1 PD-(D/E)XK nuclease superfamily protein [Nitratiruptor tergarcus DSM 16512]